MWKILSRCAVALIALVMIATFVRANQQAVASKSCTTLVGSWKLASARYGGNDYAAPGTTIKHVTPVQFMWASYGADGVVTRAAGGAYTLKGDAYQETPEYGISSDFDVVRGKPQTFTCRIDGNKWYHSGVLSNGLTIDEVWERVEPK